MTSVAGWLRKAKKQIDALDAEVILTEVLQADDRSYLTLNNRQKLEAVQEKKADKMLARRAKGEPLAYIIGYKEFYGRKFPVNRACLIPRPESEAIVRLALKMRPKPKKILDVGSGSGCLALTLAAELGPKTVVCGADISLLAILRAARTAVAMFGEEKEDRKISFDRSNLLSNIEHPATFDLVVANLPYVNQEWDWIDKKTLSFEPRKALYAGDNGLAVIKRLLREMKTKRMRCPIILEADPSQHKEIIAYAKELGYQHKKTDGFAIMLKRSK